MNAEPEAGDVAAVTAIVTAWRRAGQTIATIEKLRACHPAPDEILVHVDGDETATTAAIKTAFPDIPVIESAASIGPGGGRNKLVAAARNTIVAAFDDDSYPADADYFARAAFLFGRFPETVVIGAAIFHRHEPEPQPLRAAGPAASFVGCGTVYQRDAYLEAGGYVPLALAYGMEEEDLALRFMDQGKLMLHSPWLRVFHDTDLSHHAAPALTAAQIANTALHAYLRYPPRYWPYGAAQVLNRVLWCARNGRTRGIASGLAQIPGHLWRHRSQRKPVSAGVIRARRQTRGAHMPLQSFDS